METQESITIGCYGVRMQGTIYWLVVSLEQDCLILEGVKIIVFNARWWIPGGGKVQFGGLAQDCNISIANILEIPVLNWPINFTKSTSGL